MNGQHGTTEYESLLQRLFHINRQGGMKLGLQNVQQLQAHLGYPDHHFQCIHVAGTNGKGSVCLKIASTLQQAGYRVGLYTSPHLSCFRERIRINGQMIEEEEVVDRLIALFSLIDRFSIPATFFELTTLLALTYFADQQVDVVVLETGLGGRLDATNIVTPLLSVITSISFDHTELLGDSLDAIAYEKGGIIKQGVPVVIGPRVPVRPIRSIAEALQSPYTALSGQFSSFEEENKSIARTALESLSSHFSLCAQAIEEGLAMRQPCRMEWVSSTPPIVLDVAHNPDGLLHLFSSLKHQRPGCMIHTLVGLSSSKDIAGCLATMHPHVAHFHLVQAENGRGAPVEILYQLLLSQGIHPSHITSYGAIKEGFFSAKQSAAQAGALLAVCGTFFIMGEVRQALHIPEPRDAYDLNERLIPTPRLNPA